MVSPSCEWWGGIARIHCADRPLLGTPPCTLKSLHKAGIWQDVEIPRSPLGYILPVLSASYLEQVLSWTGREPGHEIFLAITLFCPDIVALQKQEWPERRQTGAAAMFSVLSKLHVKHSGHPGGLYTLFSPLLFSEDTKSIWLKATNPSTDVTLNVKPPWLRAIVSARLLN